MSGPYSAEYNGLPLGANNDDGFVLMGTYQGQEVNQSDAYGQTLVEAIHRGINWKLRFRGLEFNKTGMLNAIQVFGSTGVVSTTLTPTLGAIGERYTAKAKALVLTSILGAYPPTMPTTLTANTAIVSPQSNVEYLMTSKVREAPFEMVLFPYFFSTGVNISFSTT